MPEEYPDFASMSDALRNQSRQRRGMKLVNPYGGRENITAEDREAVGSALNDPAPGAHHSVNPDQLKMFMSAREIQNTYQVLDADRQEKYDDRAYELTKRSETTAGAPNMVIPMKMREGGSTASGYAWLKGYYNTEQLAEHPYYRGTDYDTETDEQVWQRKLSETHMSPMEYGEIHGMSPEQEAGPPQDVEDLFHHGKIGSETMNELIPTHHPRHGEAGTATWDDYYNRLEKADYALAKGQGEWEEKYGDYAPTLYQKIRQQGVTHPVHLGTNIGGQGKPQVVGGHHRIAAMAEIDPDRLIPVLHHKSIGEARFGAVDEYGDRQPPGYKYT